ncbi:MAG: hypothetical protein R2838_13610 [Caldilineaceae bacterium]
MQGFSGCRRELLTLHEWLTGGDDLPVIAISGEQGNGKSTVATAAAWNHFYHFADGIVRVSAAGTNPFRLYDVVRTFDTILGTNWRRVSEDRWGISILEQLYRRKRLLIVDKLAESDRARIGNAGQHHRPPAKVGRPVAYSAHRPQFQPQHRRTGPGSAPASGRAGAGRHSRLRPQPAAAQPEAAARGRLPPSIATHGRPLLMRMVLGLLLDYDWQDLSALLLQFQQEDGSVPVQDVVSFAVESYAVNQPAVGPLLNRLVSAAGGASLTAMHELFWRSLGASDELDQVLAELEDRTLLEVDNFKQRRWCCIPWCGAILSRTWSCWARIGSAPRSLLFELCPSTRLPHRRWPEVDVEWATSTRPPTGSRLARLWQDDALTVLEDPGVDITAWMFPPRSPARDDLRLSREYALALAYRLLAPPAGNAALAGRRRSRRWPSRTSATMHGCRRASAANSSSSAASTRPSAGSTGPGTSSTGRI